MKHNEVSDVVLKVALEIHINLGPGLLESVYESILDYELRERYHLKVERQVAFPLFWKGMKMGRTFRADLIVKNLVVVEVKVVDFVSDAHKKQLQTYLKISGLKLGLILNFNLELMKYGIHRTVLGIID